MSTLYPDRKPPTFPAESVNIHRCFLPSRHKRVMRKPWRKPAKSTRGPTHLLPSSLSTSYGRIIGSGRFRGLWVVGSRPVLALCCIAKHSLRTWPKMTGSSPKATLDFVIHPKLNLWNLAYVDLLCCEACIQEKKKSLTTGCAHFSSAPAALRNLTSGRRWLNTASPKVTPTHTWCWSVRGEFPTGLPWRRHWCR